MSFVLVNWRVESPEMRAMIQGLDPVGVWRSGDGGIDASEVWALGL